MLINIELNWLIIKHPFIRERVITITKFTSKILHFLRYLIYKVFDHIVIKSVK